MQPLIPRAGFFPSLVFDPDVENARSIAGVLEQNGIVVRTASSSLDALRSAKAAYYRVVIVVADLANEDCLQFLASMHRAAPRSWIVVANGSVNQAFRRLAYRHGADALVKAPVDVPDLIKRISSFQARSRPLH